MIPKIIHYCWFGGSEKPKEVYDYINSWKRILPEYQIVEWNEHTFNMESLCTYALEAYESKKWAFVTDFVRLKVLYEYGGIYLDTDVKVLRSFDNLLSNESFIGAESMYSVCTATIGAELHSNFIKKLLNLYDGRRFNLGENRVDNTPNSKIIFEFLGKEYGYTTADKIENYDDVTIYPVDYFSPINCYDMRENITSNTYSIHYYSSSWKTSGQKVKDRILVALTRVIGEDNREKLKKLLG